MVEILWESKETNADGKPYLTVKKEGGWYLYSERLGKDSVAFILYDRNATDDVEFGLINEVKPPLGEGRFLTTAFGGSIDKELSYTEIVQEEVEEESGYKVKLENIIELGKVMVSTQMNQMCYLYLVDVTGIETSNVIEDNTSVQWVNAEEIVDGPDWKASVIIFKSIHRGIVS